MNGVVSLLDDFHNQAVHQLWAELAENFGLKGISITPIPHFSYHVAQAYDDSLLEQALTAVADKLEPFEVQTGGLGIFSGPVPVLYIAVTRTAELSRIHEQVYQHVVEHSRGEVSYYQPPTWTPHITLAHGDLTPAILGNVIPLLAGRNFDWRIKIDNVATIYSTGVQHTLRSRFPLGTQLR
jgi:2'-5' RNA ligase